MKVLITSDWYEPITNGVVTSVSNLRQGLLDLGHEVRVFTLSDKLRTHTEQNGVYYLHSLNAGFVYPDARCGLPAGHAFRRSIFEWQPDIVHSQTEFSTFFVARQVARRLRIPHVHTYHTIYENYTHYFSPNHRVGKWGIARFSRNRLNRTDAIVVPTKKTAQHLLSYRLRPPVHVIPSGADISHFAAPLPTTQLQALRQELKIPEDAFVLLQVGRIGREKNIEGVLESLAQLEQHDLYLILVGDGPHMEEIRREVHRLALENQVRFTGKVPHAHIPAYYQMADLFVNASKSETQGLTFGEALASGLPVLCYQDSCLEDVVINGFNGYQCATEKDFIRELANFIDHPELRTVYGENAKTLMQDKFSRETFAHTMETLYVKQCRQYGMRVIPTELPLGKDRPWKKKP